MIANSPHLSTLYGLGQSPETRVAVHTHTHTHTHTQDTLTSNIRFINRLISPDLTIFARKINKSGFLI